LWPLSVRMDWHGGVEGKIPQGGEAGLGQWGVGVHVVQADFAAICASPVGENGKETCEASEPNGKRGVGVSAVKRVWVEWCGKKVGQQG